MLLLCGVHGSRRQRDRAPRYFCLVTKYSRANKHKVHLPDRFFVRCRMPCAGRGVGVGSWEGVLSEVRGIHPHGALYVISNHFEAETSNRPFLAARSQPCRRAPGFRHLRTLKPGIGLMRCTTSCRLSNSWDSLLYTMSEGSRARNHDRVRSPDQFHTWQAGGTGRQGSNSSGLLGKSK